MNCTSGTTLHWTTYLHCVPASWASSYKGVPGILFEPIGQRGFFHSGKAVWLYPHKHLHQPNRAAPSWPIRTVPFEPIKLWGFGFLICMRTDQTGTRDRDFCLYKSAPSLPQRAHFPFSSKTEDHTPGWCWNTKNVLSEQDGAGQHGAGQCKVDWSRWNR